MPRIAGINIPEKKRIDISLTYIYGIGLSLSRRILANSKINPKKKAGELSTEEVSLLKSVIEKEHKVEGDLKRDKIMRVKFLKDINCWRGLRHAKGLPVRGQTTRRNSRTIRGNVRRTVTSGRRPPPTPT